MNNVSLQLQQYRALKAQTALKATPLAADVLVRHAEKTDYFQKLMERWQQSGNLNSNGLPFATPAKVSETV